MRYARLDNNQRGVVEALRKLPGVTVYSTASVAKGFPDIVVGYEGRSYLFEIKDPAKPPSHRRLTEAEAAFAVKWRGHLATALTWQEIAQAIGYAPALQPAPGAGNKTVP